MDAKETIISWYKKMDEYKEKVRQGIPLTKDEEADWDFMDQKLDDWRSDYYGMENY